MAVQPQTPETRAHVVRITLVTMIINIFLAVGKIITGLLAGSSALVSDGANSASDVMFEVIVIIGVKLSGRAADKDHPYGHERFESLVTLILAGIIFATGASIGLSGVQKIIAALRGTTPAIPQLPALIVAVVVIVIKGVLYFYTKARSKTLGSEILVAATSDHLADILGTLSGLVGIAGARLGLPILDPIACLVIAVLIIKTSIGIFMNAASQMTDKSAGPEIEATIRALVAQYPGIARVDGVQTRLFGDRIFVDIEIAVDGNKTISFGHKEAELVHLAIEKNLPQVKHCMVHVNPA